MDSFSRLLANDLIQQLLMFDVTLVGSVVRESLHPDFDFQDFVDDGGVVVGHCPLTVKNFVERALFDQIIRSTIEMTTMANVIVHYILHGEDETTIRLRIGYFKVIQQEFPKVDVDVNALSLSRAGLFVDPLLVHSKPSTMTAQPPPYISVPNPLGTLIKMCREKTFSIISPQTDTVFKTMRASQLIERGWLYTGSSLVRVSSKELPKDDVCSICSDSFSPTKPVFETRCGHLYHGKCWKQYFESKDIVPGGVPMPFLSCPLCRENMHIYEALLPTKIQ